MNKLLLAGVLLLVGGFMLGGAVGGDLIARIGNIGKPEKATISPVTSHDPAACQIAFRDAETKYHRTVKAAQDDFAKARKAKEACMKALKSVSPSPKQTTTVRP